MVAAGLNDLNLKLIYFRLLTLVITHIQINYDDYARVCWCELTLTIFFIVCIQF